jgi:Zn-dependent M28 family amino/carboxypeptidase
MLLFVLLLADGLQTQLRQHVAFLADDALKGRPFPSAELDKAAEYIAANFADAGLEPLNGNRFQDAPQQMPGLRNVLGWLPGEGEAVLVLSAHYDHIGWRELGEEDGIFNGACDNASSVAALIELARSLAGQPQRRFSILFVAFSGEEKGLLGSRHFIENPPLPLSRLAYMLNLEQLGRSDEHPSPPERPSRAISFTGHQRTNAASLLLPCAEHFQLPIFHHEVFSERYFLRSDNAPFAAAGIACNTLSAVYSFPEYHQVDDEIDRLDFDLLAGITRTLHACLSDWLAQGRLPQQESSPSR